MKKLLFILAAIALTASPAMAGGFELFGSYADTKDAEDTFGGGIGFGIPLGSSPLSLQLRGTYYKELSDDSTEALFDPDDPFFREDSLKILPIEVGLRYNFETGSNFQPWIGGGGSYVLLDSTRNGVDVDDETGWYASVGSRFGDDDGVGFFAEAMYRSTEATVERDPDSIDDIDDVGLADRVKIELDGFVVNAGLSWRF